LTAREEVVLIRGAFNATDALCVAATLTGDLDAKVESDRIFPYYCYDAVCRVPTLTGRKRVSIVCLVDAVNGLGSTADGFELETESVPASRVLEAGIDRDEATSIAGRTVTHDLGRRTRSITSFDVELRARGLVYKRFFIVRTSEARLLVDSTTAGWFPLKLRAA